MRLPWTSEQLLALSPDVYIMRAARVIADPRKWQHLTFSADADHPQQLLSGQFEVSNRDPFNVAVEYPALRFQCNCKNHKQPCNHGIALLLLQHQQPKVFTHGRPPIWLDLPPLAASQAPLLTAAERSRRLRQLQRGLDELQLFLEDIVRTGLATLPQQKAAIKGHKGLWDAQAARLADVYAPALGDELRAYATLIDTHPDWADPLLARLGRLYLLAEAFKQFENGRVAQQNDLLSAVGWLPSFEDAPHINDTWHIVGQTITQQRKRLTQQIWLYGEQTGQTALLKLMAYHRRDLPHHYVIGTQFNGTLRIAHSTTPLYANIVSADPPTQITSIPLPKATIQQAHQQITHKAARNPWQTQHPHILVDTSAEQQDGHWILTDPKGYQWPLPNKFELGWHLKALANAPLFGVWNTTYFEPLSVWCGDYWLDLKLLQGVT